MDNEALKPKNIIDYNLPMYVKQELANPTPETIPEPQDKTSGKIIASERLGLDVENKAKDWFKGLNINEMAETVALLLSLEKDLAGNKALETRRRLAQATFSVGDRIFADLMKENSRFGLDQNRLSPRKGFEPSVVPNKKTETKSTEKPAPNQEKPEHPIEQVSRSEEKFFSDPSILNHEIVAGDSLWNIYKKILEK